MKYLLLSLIILMCMSCLSTFKKGEGAVPITVSSVRLNLANVNKTQGLHFGQDATTVTVYNPFNVSLSLELKCNWDNKYKRWKQWHYWTLLKKQNVKILIPAKSKCQIWPHRER